MGLRDLAAQRQSQARAIVLGGIKRQQRLRQHHLGHAGTAIADLDALFLRGLLHQNADLGRIATGLVGILQDIDQRLFQLQAIKPTRIRR